jgi:hypothetical protein
MSNKIVSPYPDSFAGKFWGIFLGKLGSIKLLMPQIPIFDYQNSAYQVMGVREDTTPLLVEGFHFQA